MMNRLLFQIFRRSPSLSSAATIPPIPILTTTTTNANRTYSSDSTLIRRKESPRRTVRRFCGRNPPPLHPPAVRNLHEQIQSLTEDPNPNLNAASRVLRDAIVSGISPMNYTCICLLRSMCNSGLYEDTISLFNFLYNQDSELKPTIDHYDSLIRAYLGSGRLDEALQVYRSIRDLHSEFNYFHYGYFVQGLVQANRISDAMEIHRDMLASNTLADPIAFNCIIAAYLQLNDVESAFKLFDEFVQIIHKRHFYCGGDGIVFATIMDHYFKNNMEKKAMELYQDFLGCKVRMDEDTCNAMLEVFLKYGKLVEADRIFEGIMDHSRPPNVTTFRILFDAYAEQNRTDDLLKWLNYMLFKTKLVPKSELLDSVLSKLINKGRSEEVAEILGKIPAGSEKIFPVSSYQIILADLCKEGKVDKVRDLLYIKEKHNISIAATLHGIIHEAFANEKKGKGRSD